MNLYGNYIEESTYLLIPVNEQEILDEAAGLDIYHKFVEAKKYYREQKYNLEEAINEGEIKEAKDIIHKTVDYLMKVGKEIKAIDDTEFTDRVSVYAIQTIEFFAKSLGDMLFAAGADVGGKVAKNTLAKHADKLPKFIAKGVGTAEKLTVSKLATGAAIAAVLAIAKPLYKEIELQMKTHEKMQYKIRREMNKNHKTEEEAKKAVGSIYKNEILDYLSDIITDLNKLDRELKV